MKLKEWLEANRLSIVEFATMVDYSPSFISSVMGGHVICGIKFRKRVNIVTLGEVGLDEWLSKKDEKE